jgi:prolyl 4-hydroxylase
MLSLQTNRAKTLFEKAVNLYNAAFGNAADDQVFSYWCKFYGKNPDEDPGSIALLEPDLYNRLESKITVLKLLREHGIENVFPAGYTRVAETLTHPEPVRVWFSKPGHLSGGRGIEVISGKALRDYALPPFHMLQAGVDSPALIDGKKFTARIYVLLWNGQVYLFDDGFVLIHGSVYVPGSTDYGVQVDHRGYDREDGRVKMILCSDNVRTGSLVTAARKPLCRMIPILEETRAATSLSRYLILGIDVIQKTDGSIIFIEINAIPNFVHNRRVNELLNIPMLEHVMRITTGCYSHRFDLLARDDGGH